MYCGAETQAGFSLSVRTKVTGKMPARVEEAGLLRRSDLMLDALTNRLGSPKSEFNYLPSVPRIAELYKTNSAQTWTR